MTHDSRRHDAALDWLVRTNDPDFADWDAFTAWLEEDPAGADAYHALAASEAELRPLLEEPPQPAPRQPRRVLPWGVLGAAAAALAGLLVAPRLIPVDYATEPGEVRVIALGGEDRLVLNGGTSLQLAGFDRRTVRLAHGQVLLSMREPAAEKIEVEAGDLRLVDVGTVFEVSRDGPETRVLVSEGAVVANPRGARLELSAGEGLYTRDGADVLRAVPADSASVGAFVDGNLNYAAEPIANVAADLRRSTGIDFSVGPAIKDRRFSGTLSVDEVKRDPRSLGPLIDVSVERSGGGWALVERR